MHGGRHILPLGGGVMAFMSWSGEDSKTGKRPKKNFCIPIFFKVVQGNPITYLLLTFLRDFLKLFLKSV